MRRFLRVSFLLPSFFVGLAISRPGVCFGSAFKVTPVTILLSRRTPTALLTLKNESDRRLRFQARVFLWDQTPEGQMQLAATQDIVFFPTLLSVEPGEERKVRIGSAAAFGPMEKAYRVFFEELPELEKAADSRGSRLQIRTRMGIPIFLQPQQTEKGSRVDAIEARAGVLRFSVRNTGNVHVNLRGIRVKGLDPMGDSRFERESDGWYVLAGGSRDYEVEIPEDQCGRVARFVIEAQVDENTVLRNLASSAASCR
ncbi:MAG TPA: fimbria/pilus periplasmic chaperone [Thermoanaerobaculia bacterium]